jgi:DamX protein
MNLHPESHSSELSDQALQALNLHTQPFCDRPAGHEYFSDPVIQMQLNMLQHNLKFSDMLQILKGDAGCGKTALVVQMLANANDDFQIFVARGEPSLTALQVLTGMLSVFQQHIPQDTETCLEILTGHLKIRLEKNLSSVLIIEDAHEIAVESLNQVFAYTDKINETLEGELRILLVADTEIESILPELTSNQLREGRFFISNVRTLDLKRTGSYLKYRLQKAGFKGKPPFDGKQLSALFKNTDGIPQQVDAFAAGILNRQAERVSIVTRLQKLPLRLLSGAAAAAIVISLLLFWLGETPDAIAPNDDAGAGARVELKPTPIAGAAEPTVGVVAGESGLSVASRAEGNGKSAPAGESSPEHQSAAIALPGEPGASADFVFAESHGIAAIEADKMPKEIQPTEELQLPEVEETAPQPEMREPSRSEIWLLSQNTADYTIQLLAVSDIVELSRYTRSHNIESQTALFETSRNSRRWYVLTYGVFSSAGDARVAIAKLPDALRRNSPWIRSIKSVQLAIGKRQP